MDAKRRSPAVKPLWPSQERDEAISKLYSSGVSKHVIGERFGLTTGRIDQIIKKIAMRNSYLDGDIRAHLSARAANHLAHLAATVRDDMKWKFYYHIAPEQIAAFSEAQLMAYPNLGRKSVDEIKVFLKRHGLELRPNGPHRPTIEEIAMMPPWSAPRNREAQADRG